MLFAPLLDYTEHSSSMSGGGPEQSEVISAVNTSSISLGAEINTRHSIYLKQGERGHKHSWVDLFTDVLSSYLQRPSLCKLFYNWINWSWESPLSCRVCDSARSAAVVSRDQTTHNRSLHIPGLNTSTTSSSSAVTGSHFYTHTGLIVVFYTHMREK